MAIVARLLVFVALIVPVQAQDLEWIPLDGPDGGAIVRALAEEADGALLAATEGGVYRLADGAAAWERDSEGLFIDNTTAFWSTSEDAMLVGTFGVGVYRRPAGGLTWTPTPLNQIVTVGFAQRDTTIYAASPDAFFASTDDGRTWRRLPGLGVAGVAVSGIAANDDYLFAATDTGVFRTNDDGNTWEFIVGPWGDFPNITAITADPANGTVYVGASPLSAAAGVYRSRNNGGLWTRTPVDPVFVSGLYAANDAVYAGDFQFIHRSTNEGLSWRSARATVTTVLGFHARGDTLWAATEGRGVLRSTDGGGSWGDVNDGLQSSIHTLAADDDLLYAGTSGGVYVSADRGASWTLRDAGLTTFNVRDITIGPDGLAYAATFGEVYLYSNTDAEWKPIGPAEGLSMRELTFGPDGTLYAAYFEGLYLRENRQWTPLPVVGEDGLTRDIAAAVVAGAGRIFAGGAFDAFRYDADFARWTPMFRDGLTPFSAQTFLASGDTLWAATRFSGLLQTTDAGDNWQRVSPLAPQDLRGLVQGADGWLYTAAFGNGVYRFHPGSDNAELFSDGLTDTRVTDILFAPDGTGYVSTSGRGLFRLGVPSQTSTAAEEVAPSFTVAAYPNPGTSRLTLSIDAPAGANVSYAVYDVLGRRVLYDAVSSPHQQIDAQTLPAGTYVVQVSAEHQGGLTRRHTTWVKTR
ncbi:MAG: T9SS type A sorting domain-containing protein [Bacteroidota bacterium]